MTLCKTVWIIAVLAVLLPACNTPPAPAPAATAVPAPTGLPRFASTDCWFKEPAGRDVECGWVTVPEDHAKPDGKTIQLAVARFKSDAASPEPDPIVYLHGGPGGSILKSNIMEQFDLLFGPLLAKRDLILFDQRGIGYSQPALDCPELVELAFDMLDEDLNAAESEDLNNKALLACRDRLSQQGINLDAYNSVQNAADLEAMRKALGYEKVNLYGISYGTRLALTALRDQPSGIRSVIIDSVYTPQEDLFAAVPANGARAIEALFAACAAEAGCNESFPNLSQTFFDLKAKLDQAPVKFDVSLKSGEKKDMLLNGDGLVALVFQAMYDSTALPLLPRLISDINRGNYDLAAVLEGALLDELDTTSTGMQYAVQCNEEVPFARQSAIDDALKQYPAYAALVSLDVIDTCKAFGVKPADPVENQPISSDVPTLAISGEFDPITPPSWAEAAVKTLSKSFYFNVPRAGHGSSISVECPRNIMLAFLDDPSQPPNSDCLAERAQVKFAVPPQAADYDMVPFEDAQLNIQGLVPDGWKKLGPGTYTPTGAVTDLAGLVQQAAPLPANTLLNLLENQLKAADPTIEFKQAGTRSAKGIDWKLYSAASSASNIDLALGEKDNMTYLVMLQGLAIDHQVLYEAVFLPAVDALQTLQ
jgi:pimeloyl-ACP methyl ester carboxylesterase